MAKLIVDNSFDALMKDISALANLPDSLVEDILNAEADVVVNAQQQEIKKQWSGPYSEGISAKSVKKTKVRKTKDGHIIYIYPQGTRKRGKTRIRNAEIAFLNEYGSSGPGRDKRHKKRTDPKKILPRPAIRDANEKAIGQAIGAGEKVLQDYLDKHNL